MRRWMLIIGLAMVSALSGACTDTILGVDGSGVADREDRSVDEFDAVVIRSVGTARIEIGDSASLTIEADDNLIQYITSEVEDGALVLATDRTIDPSVPVTYSITVPALRRVEVTGSGGVEVGVLHGDRFAVNISGSGGVVASGVDVSSVTVAIGGSGSVEMVGTTDELIVAINGSGNYLGQGLTADVAQVGVYGSGTIVVGAANTLTGELDGSGDIEYLGDPIVDVEVSGSGTVTHR